MGQRKVFQCEVTISSVVREKFFKKHNIEIWEVEEVIYDDPHAFSITYRDCYFLYGQTFSGRYLLILVTKPTMEKVNVVSFALRKDLSRTIVFSTKSCPWLRWMERRDGGRSALFLFLVKTQT